MGVIERVRRAFGGGERDERTHRERDGEVERAKLARDLARVEARLAALGAEADVIGRHHAPGAGEAVRRDH